MVSLCFIYTTDPNASAHLCQGRSSAVTARKLQNYGPGTDAEHPKPCARQAGRLPHKDGQRSLANLVVRASRPLVRIGEPDEPLNQLIEVLSKLIG